MWKRKTVKGKPDDAFDYLHSGRINLKGREALNAFGDDMTLIVYKPKRKRKVPNAPDYILVACPSWGKPTEETWWDGEGD
ncbi:MAG: hypothetical protein EHM49_01795 [Deltaproteobacteria bacterium]|nr:MAG: hypothetical protein EHM49_01795 [Deltaproteobacteria bacterium]